MSRGEPLLQDPMWFLHRINFASGAFEFRKVRRDDISAATFLDEGTLSSHTEKRELSFSEFRQNENRITAQSPAGNFVFHIGFCCSTLLMRALDCPGTVLSLREPNLFHNLSDSKVWQKEKRFRQLGFDAALAGGLRFLNKAFEDGESIVIKPPNVTNNLAHDILAADEAARAVLLFIPLKQFLVSILKKGEAGKAFARKLFIKISREKNIRAAVGLRAPGALTDLQISAVLWAAQMLTFRDVLQTFPDTRVLLVNGEKLIEEPVMQLERISGHFGFSLGREYFETVVAGPVFRTDAKNPARAYSPLQRREEYRAIYRQNYEAVEAIMKWCFPQLQRMGLDKVSLWAA